MMPIDPKFFRMWTLKFLYPYSKRSSNREKYTLSPKKQDEK